MLFLFISPIMLFLGQSTVTHVKHQLCSVPGKNWNQTSLMTHSMGISAHLGCVIMQMGPSQTNRQSAVLSCPVTIQPPHILCIFGTSCITDCHVIRFERNHTHPAQSGADRLPRQCDHIVCDSIVNGNIVRSAICADAENFVRKILSNGCVWVDRRMPCIEDD